MKIILWVAFLVAIVAGGGAFKAGELLAGLVLFLSALLICPQSHNWFRGKFGEKASPRFLVSIGILTFFISGFFVTDDTEIQPYEDSSKSEIKQLDNQQEERLLSLSVLQFRDSYNGIVNSLQLDQKYLFTEPKYSNGEVNDTYTHTFTDSVVLMGTLVKDTNDIMSLIVISTPYTESDLADSLVIMSAVVGAFSPDTTPRDRGEIILPMLQNAIQNGEDGDLTRGNVKYSVTYNKQVGLWFSVEPV